MHKFSLTTMIALKLKFPMIPNPHKLCNSTERGWQVVWPASSNILYSMMELVKGCVTFKQSFSLPCRGEVSPVTVSTCCMRESHTTREIQTTKFSQVCWEHIWFDAENYTIVRTTCDMSGQHRKLNKNPQKQLTILLNVIPDAGNGRDQKRRDVNLQLGDFL